MKSVKISFSLRDYRIGINISLLRALGSPNRICFMLDEKGEHLLLMPYSKRDLKSHLVPPYVYAKDSGLRISSYKLCCSLAAHYKWDMCKTYFAPGRVLNNQNAAVFELGKAETE